MDIVKRLRPFYYCRLAASSGIYQLDVLGERFAEILQCPGVVSRSIDRHTVSALSSRRAHNKSGIAKRGRFGHLPLSTSGPQDCALEGSTLLQTPYLNRGSAFTKEERDEFKLNSLLPSRVNTLDEQVKRAYDQYCNKRTAVGKNTFITSMKEQNEVLYYGLIQDHLKEMFPIIYTPTAGEAIQDYSRSFRKPEGCFLNIAKPDNIENALDR